MEGLFAPFPRHLSGSAFPGHLRFREDQFQPDQPKVDTDTYVEIDKDELDNIALESTRTIEIDEFVPKADIDPRYAIRPYYLVPDGKVGHDAYAVIRETIRSMNMVAIGRLVLTSREHIIALEPLKNGLARRRRPRGLARTWSTS